MSNTLKIEYEDLYQQALRALNGAGVGYMVGGAFAVYHYTNWWRSTHDIDVYVLPGDRDKALAALTSRGFTDIGEQAEGDHQWIYHTSKGEIIVDIIWRFANLANYVSPEWFERSSKGRFLEMDLSYLPLEEFIWLKVFVINRHRCDWPDLMRILREQCQAIDWDRLLGMLDENWLLLAGLIDVFDWQFSHCVACIPTRVREQLAERRRNYTGSSEDLHREQLLDPWIHQRADRYAVWRDE